MYIFDFVGVNFLSNTSNPKKKLNDDVTCNLLKTSSVIAMVNNYKGELKTGTQFDLLLT